MAKDDRFYVYIMTNKHNTVLYTGVTSDLTRRVAEHRRGRGGRFTAKYRINKLVYFEVIRDIVSAIEREKSIKAGSRAKKTKLIESENPSWEDLWHSL